tara:strand:+ start:3027 stop:3422 length:396 start_codon:yes stop_codon:yes gene_type:complete
LFISKKVVYLQSKTITKTNKMENSRQQLIEMLQKEQNEKALKIANRKYIGEDNKGRKVFLERSEYNLEKLVLKVENAPSGWYIDDLEGTEYGDSKIIAPNNTITVCYDGGQKWYGTIKFYDPNRFYAALVV